MKKLIFTIPIFAIFLIVACQSNDPNHLKEEALKDELMVIHDEVMPKMGDINDARKKLVKLSEKLNTEDSVAIVRIKETINALELADEGMMDWMGDFKRPSQLRGKKSHEEIMAYLEEEKQKVQKVKDDILNSIESATVIIDEFKKAE